MQNATKPCEYTDVVCTYYQNTYSNGAWKEPVSFFECII